MHIRVEEQNRLLAEYRSEFIEVVRMPRPRGGP